MAELYCLKSDMGFAEQFNSYDHLPEGVVAITGVRTASPYGDVEEDTIYAIYSQGETQRVRLGEWIVTSPRGTRSVFDDVTFRNLFVPSDEMVAEIQRVARSAA
jgi:hypothetical protein